MCKSLSTFEWCNKSGEFSATWKSTDDLPKLSQTLYLYIAQKIFHNCSQRSQDPGFPSLPDTYSELEAKIQPPCLLECLKKHNTHSLRLHWNFYVICMTSLFMCYYIILIAASDMYSLIGKQKNVNNSVITMLSEFICNWSDNEPSLF